MFKVALLLFAGIFVSDGLRADVVDLTYVYETRCPYCLEFLHEQFYDGYQQVGSYVNLTLLTFAKIDDDGDVYCQHGDNECFISRAQVCAFKNGISQNRQVEFLYCTETKAWDGLDITEDDVKVCLANVLTEVSWNDVQSCMTSGEADELLKAIYVKAKSYGVSYVPSLIFFGRHDVDLEDSARDNFVATICGLLSNQPEVCN
ncbi:GILT-like protein 1 [Rhynchophorus ferrugineus]|uniref:GILT-like protein 1 n=1 Tax=Rhynchophorus ferrugineus TaxID=354439 RepID=UPI003FCD613C